MLLFNRLKSSYQRYIKAINCPKKFNNSSAIDEFLLIFICSAFAEGISTFKGLEELNNKDPVKRYVRIKEEINSIKKESSHKFEENKQQREEKTLEAMESLFHTLGG